MQTHDRSRMPLVYVVLVQPGFGACAVVAIGLVDVPFFGTHPERRRLVVGKIERCNCNLARFVVARVNQLKGFLASDGCLVVHKSGRMHSPLTWG
jgi:hypothetical protein